MYYTYIVKLYKYEVRKRLIYDLDRGKCHICKKRVPYSEAVLDHIIPRLCFSPFNDNYWNLRIAHKACNYKRGPARIAGQIRLPFPLEGDKI